MPKKKETIEIEIAATESNIKVLQAEVTRRRKLLEKKASKPIVETEVPVQPMAVVA